MIKIARKKYKLCLSYVEEFFAGFALIVVVLSVCWGVVTRYITETPATWTTEIATIAFAWLVFVGAAAAFKYNMHMSVDVVMNLFPRTVRRAIMALIDLLIVVFLAYLVVLAWIFSLASMGDPLPILRWPRSILYSSVLIGSACMTVRYTQFALRRWRGDQLATMAIADGEHDGAL